MTALGKYLRLEAVGLWREAPDAEPREVIVSLGRTTLLLTDLNERPLGHWTLGGIRIEGQDESGATIYAMSAGETLAIRDRDMVGAIEAVRRELPDLPAPREKRRPRRGFGGVLVVLALVALVAIAPPSIRRATARLIPPEQEEEIGQRMLIALIERNGPVCDDPAGVQALATLAHTVAGSHPPPVRVMQLGATGAAVLPGPILLIDREAVSSEPEEQISGWMVRADEAETLPRLVLDAGIIPDLRYVFTGRFDDAALARAAESAATLPAPSALIGESDMTESGWEALRGICKGG